MVDAKTNTVWAHTQLELVEAEALGAENLKAIGCKWMADAAPTLQGAESSRTASADATGSDSAATAGAFHCLCVKLQV